MIIIVIAAGCANITAPTGGKKDVTPPKMVSIDPADSLLNTKVKRIEMHFDEYITVSDVSKEVQLSPILSIQPTETGRNKTVIVKIVDSLLEDNTTYRLSLGSSIRDLHEGNAFPKYTYTFSTGAYFDSLELRGSVINAVTGLPDTGGISVVLFSAKETDSAIVQHKPKYITTADASGNFVFKGLPKRSFRIYALKDVNNNMLYDGPGAGEWVGFIDHTVIPGDTTQANVNLRLFMETPDTSLQKSLDSMSAKREGRGKSKPVFNDALSYSVNIDTSNIERRLFDITGYVIIAFNKQPVLNKEKITLTYDSLGNTVTPKANMVYDSVLHRLKIYTEWQENMEYKLRLVKGFAKDSAGVDVVPSRYSFRTKEDDDYGKITIHLPAKYSNSDYLLKVLADNDSVYQQSVTDATIVLRRLKPAAYTIRLIVDKNRNGKWDTGDLLAKRQPEEVIPYKEIINLKAGWENVVDDFEKKLPLKPLMNKNLPGMK